MKGLSALLKSAHREKVCWNPIRVQLPDGSFKPIPCKARAINICKPCATLFKADWQRIFYSGIYDDENNIVEGYSFYFITMTAGSFGRVHRKKGCPCGIRHSDEEIKGGIAGVPLRITDEEDGLVPEDWDHYFYEDQIAWQLNVSKLWQTAKERLRYYFGGEAAWTKSVEDQARGVAHFHLLVRIPDGLFPDDYVASSLNDLRFTKTRDGKFGFGAQFDLKRISGGDARRYANYSAKVLNYSLKNITASRSEDSTVKLHPSRVRYEARLRAIAKNTRCLKRTGCDGSCKSLAHRNFGYAGRPATTSSNWSFSGLNRTVLKQKRRDYVLKYGSDTATETYEALLLSAIADDEENHWEKRSPSDVERLLAEEHWNAPHPDERVPLPRVPI